MRFLVDLYRYIILALCALTLIGTTLLILFAFDQNNAGSAATPFLVVAGAAAVLLFLIINLGGIAILISVHDRHAELADDTAGVRDALERIATAAESGRAFTERRP